MRETLKGFLVLRLIGLLVLLIVIAVVLGIRSIAGGADAVGIAILAGGLVLAAAAWLVARRGRRRRLATQD